MSSGPLGDYTVNIVAKNVYEKVGFRETGRIPKGFFRKGKYFDDIFMTLNLDTQAEN